MNPSTAYERRALLEAICADPKLPGNALKLAMTLLAFANKETGEIFPAQRTIGARCHLSRNTIDAMGRKLEERKWLRIERDTGGDRDSNNYYFAFARVREGGDHYGFSLLKGCGELPLVDIPEDDQDAEGEFHGSKVEPCSAVHGSTSEQTMAQNSTFHGSKVQPELRENNSQKGTQVPLFEDGQLPEALPFDFETWFEQQWWPQYPAGRKVGNPVEKAQAKKLAKAIIEGRRKDGIKATPNELLAGVMQYAAAMAGRISKFITRPTKWLADGCWMDQYAARAAGGGRTASTEAVWDTIEGMAGCSRRAAG